MYSGVAGGHFQKKLEIEFALLLDSLDPYGPKYDSPKFDIGTEFFLRQINNFSSFKQSIILCFDNDYESYCICIFVFAYLRICVFVLISVLCR